MHGTRDVAHGNGATQSSAAQAAHGDVIALLREAVQSRDAMFADLRRCLDASEAERRQLSERLAGLLSHRQAGSVSLAPPSDHGGGGGFRDGAARCLVV